MSVSSDRRRLFDRRASPTLNGFPVSFGQTSETPTPARSSMGGDSTSEGYASSVNSEVAVREYHRQSLSPMASPSFIPGSQFNPFSPVPPPAEYLDWQSGSALSPTGTIRRVDYVASDTLSRASSDATLTPVVSAVTRTSRGATPPEVYRGYKTRPRGQDDYANNPMPSGCNMYTQPEESSSAERQNRSRSAQSRHSLGGLSTTSFETANSTVGSRSSAGHGDIDDEQTASYHIGTRLLMTDGTNQRWQSNVSNYSSPSASLNDEEAIIEPVQTRDSTRSKRSATRVSFGRGTAPGDA